ncbi:MAG: MazG-like family protein [Candidatus Ventricola sp.]
MSRTIDVDALLSDLQELLNQEVIGSTVSDVGNGIALAMQRVMAAQETTLNDLRDAIYEDAVAHGLWEDEEDYMPTDCVYFIKDEVNELDCAAIDWEDDIINDNSAFCDELADVIIMCLSVAGKLGIDIDAAVKRKMEINRQRPWKHGKEEQE